ncbi:hypothetical protein D3C71_1279300 [compost metagenome]
MPTLLVAVRQLLAAMAVPLRLISVRVDDWLAPLACSSLRLSCSICAALKGWRRASRSCLSSASTSGSVR